MGDLVFFNFSIEIFVTIFGINEGDFILPPHQGVPIVFTIFEELSEVIGVLTEPADDSIIRRLLTPF